MHSLKARHPSRNPPFQSNLGHPYPPSKKLSISTPTPDPNPYRRGLEDGVPLDHSSIFAAWILFIVSSHILAGNHFTRPAISLHNCAWPVFGWRLPQTGNIHAPAALTWSLRRLPMGTVAEARLLHMSQIKFGWQPIIAALWPRAPQEFWHSRLLMKPLQLAQINLYF